MIIRIEASGGSFRGAGKYYLHDKADDKSLPNELKPTTDERVWFTDVRNCAHLDPERALDEMWAVAEDQAYLKQANGISTAGRRCSDPVKTISLSWHKDDAPTPEHMVEAADQFLKHMKWDQHQAVYVGHRDTEHRHIHIILNRVHPETGRTLDDYREQKRSQQWGLAYERAQDKIRCEAREASVAQSNEFLPERHRGPQHAKDRTAERDRSKRRKRERKPANQHLPHNVIDITRDSQKQFEASEAELRDRHTDAREQLKAEQRAEREAWFKDGKPLFKELRQAVYDEVRQEYAPEWRQLYKDSREARAEAEAASATAMGRAFHFAREGRWDEAREAFGDRDAVHDAVEKDLAARKADLKARQTADVRERQDAACAVLRESREAQYQELLQHQREERAAERAGAAVGTGARERHDARADNDPANDNRRQEHGRDAPDATPSARTNECNSDHGPEAEAQPGSRDGTRGGSAFEARGEPQSDARTESDAEKSAEPRAGTYRAPESEPPFDAATKDPPEPVKQGADLAAGAIGSVASYLADQLAEAFAPTPPEVREARAKTQAKREAEALPREDAASPYARQIEAALKAFEQERQGKTAAEYWAERERAKDRDRDR